MEESKSDGAARSMASRGCLDCPGADSESPGARPSGLVGPPSGMMSALWPKETLCLWPGRARRRALLGGGAAAADRDGYM